MVLPKIHTGFDPWHIEAAIDRSVPPDMDQASDVYFLRTREIMKAKGLDPWVVAQVFVRKTPEGGIGKVDGIHEVLAILASTRFFERGGRVWAVPVGSAYKSCDTLLVIEGYAQDIVALETQYLGLLSHYITEANLGPFVLDDSAIINRLKSVQSAMKISPFGLRPITYFGARHYAWWFDSKITQLCYEADVKDAATPGGSYSIVAGPKGTIPHFLVVVMAHYYGMEVATKKATLAFDEVISPKIPRITLPDTWNKEVSDTIAAADALAGRLFAARLDTNGGVLAQGAAANYLDALQKFDQKKWWLPDNSHPAAKYFYGNGVTVTGAYAMRDGLDAKGHDAVQLILTSGFSNPLKTRAFSLAEAASGKQLFGGVGIGEVQNAFFGTMDLVAVADGPDMPFNILHKVTRGPRPNANLIPAMGDIPGRLEPFHCLRKRAN